MPHLFIISLIIAKLQIAANRPRKQHGFLLRYRDQAVQIMLAQAIDWLIVDPDLAFSISKAVESDSPS